MSWSDRRGLLRLGALAALGGLGGCGFSPMYATGTPAAAMAGRVVVEPLEGEPGFVLQQRLLERLGPADTPTHRLIVDLELEETGVALTLENATTRYNLVGVADFALIPLAADDAVLSDTVRAITGYAAPDTRTATTFASLSAERDAARRVAETLADRIVQRLALAAGSWAT